MLYRDKEKNNGNNEKCYDIILQEGFNLFIPVVILLLYHILKEIDNNNNL